jgi:hypothetical protein
MIVLLDQIEAAFKDVTYPQSYDFRKAKRDYDYEDHNDKYTDRVKWSDLTSTDLTSYGEIIFFFDSDGAKYYLVSYLVLLLRHNELFNMACFDALEKYLSDVDVQIFTKQQVSVLLNFVNYIDDEILPKLDIFDFPTEPLKEKFRNT